MRVPWKVVAVLVLSMSVRARAGEGEAHWGYAGALSPEHWGEVSAVCSTGKQQSPIDLSRSAARQTPAVPLEFSWSKVQGKVHDNGHSIQVDVEPGSFIRYGGTRFDLVQFHFHAHSEHTVDGTPTPLEAHFVHRSAAGKLAVVGVLLRQDATASSVLDPVLGKLPAPAESRPVTVDLPGLLPSDRTHWAYTGSLTTPPCSEEVQWIVLVAQPGIPAADVQAFRGRYPANARPVQPVKGRQVQLAQ